MNKNRIVSFAKKALGLYFLRVIYSIYSPVSTLLKNKVQQIKRKRTINLKSEFLALGERIEYKFPKHWICVDWEGADFNINLKKIESLPFKDESMRIIYTAHLLEHLGYESVEKVLRECYRILKKGGGIRIEVPDAALFLKAYEDKDSEFLRPFLNQQESIVKRFSIPSEELYLEDHMVVMNCLSHSYPSMRGKDDITYSNVNLPMVVSKQDFEKNYNKLPLKSFFSWAASLQSNAELETGGHQCGFTFEILSEILSSVGFENIVRERCESSGIRELGIGVDLREFEPIVVKSHRKEFSLYVEARK